jgi:hypothetical protein
VGLAVSMAAAAGASSASADTFRVTNTAKSGSGSVRTAIERANRHPGADRVTVDPSLRGTIKVPDSYKIEDSLKFRGSRHVKFVGPPNGKSFRVEPADKHTTTRVTLTRLRTKRMRVVAGSTHGAVDLTVRDARLSGKLAGGPGIDFVPLPDGELSIADSVISGFDEGVQSAYRDVTIRGTTIAHNGLGLSLVDGHFRVDDSTITQNGPGRNGDQDGGIWAAFHANLTVTRSSITGNVSSGDGGGIDASYRSFADVTNSTIAGNTAMGPDGHGGGVNGNFDLTATTVTANSAVNGAGVYGTESKGESSVVDTIIAGNDGPDCGGVVPSQGHNLFGPDGCTSAGPGDILTADPGLGPFDRKERVYPLENGSPALDAGIDVGLKVDQRGVRRHDPPDIGAYER